MSVYLNVSFWNIVFDFLAVHIHRQRRVDDIPPTFDEDVLLLVVLDDVPDVGKQLNDLADRLTVAKKSDMRLDKILVHHFYALYVSAIFVMFSIPIKLTHVKSIKFVFHL